MDSIGRRLHENNTILFLGSGFSLDAKNALGTTIPGVAGLRTELLDAIGTPREEAESVTDTLPDIADYCLSTEEGAAATASRLRQLFTVVELATWQRDLITAFPWKRVYTTNYDNAVEVACAAKRKPVTVLSALSAFERPQGVGKTVIHINGCAATVTPKSIDSEIRLSGRSYALNDFMSSRWAQLLGSDLAYCDAAVFVGFSVGDLDIGRIVISHLSKHKTHFFNGPNISKMARAKLESFGLVHATTGQELYEILRVQALGAGVRSAPTTFACFERVRLGGEATVPNDLDRRDLLIFGRVKSELVGSSLASSVIEAPYVIPRTVEQPIVDELASGNDVALLAALGNGKSVLLRKVSLRLAAQGWECFALKDLTGNWLKEVEAICGLKGNVAVIIDGAADSLNVIEALSQRRRENVRLLLAERTRRFEARFTDFRLSKLGMPDPVRHEIDLLDEQEREGVDELLSTAGLWGQQAALTKAQRTRYVMRQCRNELSSTLLHIVQSEDIASRIRQELISESFSESDYRVLVVAVALSVFGFRTPILDLGRICGTQETNNFLRVSSEFRARLYDTRGGEFRVNSKIFGQYFLRELVAPAVTLGALTSGIRSALRLGVRLAEADFDEDDDDDSRNEKFLRTANSFPAPMYVFRNIQQIVKLDAGFDELFGFYEEIKRNTRLADDPLFWLQYAIARLFSGDRDSAKRYLENSYGIAKRTGFRTYQIDNQYARWLLESSVATGSAAEAFDAFDEAHRMLVAQMADHEQAHYPFRIAIQYREFYLHHRHALAANQVEFVRNACQTVLAASQYAHVEIGKRHWVEKCRKALEMVLRISAERDDEVGLSVA